MNVLNDYQDLNIHPLQQTRLYAQGRPLIKLWRKKRKNIPIEIPDWAQLIDHELDSDYIEIDSAGWYFSNAQRRCVAVETGTVARTFWPDAHIEHDIMTWHPTYLDAWPVMIYYSKFHRYCTMQEFLLFCDLWLKSHPKLIIGLDPTKLKFNYLKFDFVDTVSSHVSPRAKLNVLQRKDFHLLFTISSV